MATEFGLKLTRVADEFTFDFAKDRAGPIFLSSETAPMFVLTAHLKGYKRGNIKIDINEDGSLIGISGERQVKETVMVGWKVYKTDTEIKGFKKVFKIPNGVILDKIKAKFNEDDSTLTITMPKKVTGIRGTAIEEVEEKQELVREGSANLQILDEKSLENDGKLKAKIGEDDDMATKGGKEMPKEENPVLEHSCTEDVQENDDLKEGEERQQLSTTIQARVETATRKEDAENQKKVGEIEERTEHTHDQELDKAINSCVRDKENKIQEERLVEEKERPSVVDPSKEALEDEGGKAEEGDEKSRKRFKMCIPIVAGSTLLLSFVVFVIQIVRSRSQNSRRRD